jgi:AAA ATPase domain
MVESGAWAPASGLIGRDVERARLDVVLDRLRQGGAGLVVRGEPGIGKSALLQHARERARELGARPLVAVGIESEAELAFAGLHALLRPIGGGVASLPDPHATCARGGVRPGRRRGAEPAAGPVGSRYC